MMPDLGCELIQVNRIGLIAAVFTVVFDTSFGYARLYSAANCGNYSTCVLQYAGLASSLWVNPYNQRFFAAGPCDYKNVGLE